jgi:hypothetical protein
MTVIISPELYFRDVLAFMYSNVFNFDFVQCMDAKKHRTFGNLATVYYYRQLTSCFAKAHTVANVYLKQLSQFPDFQMNGNVIQISRGY